MTSEASMSTFSNSRTRTDHMPDGAYFTTLMAPPYRCPSELQVRYLAPPIVLYEPAPVAPKDTPQLLHASL